MPLRRHRPVAWIAAFAVLLQALWPLLAHARPQDAALQVPICAVSGIVHDLEIKLGKTPLDDSSSKQGEHCKLCVFGTAKGVALLATPAPAVPDFASAGQKVVLAPVPFSGPASRSPAHPRAPPSQA
jgi:hypothetical protein